MTPDIIQEYNQATNLLNKQKYSKAQTIYKRILAKSQFKEAWINLGNCYRFLDQDQRAWECYQRADDVGIPYMSGIREEHYPLALNNLGLLQFCWGNDRGAIEYYDLALQCDPNFADAAWNRATALLRQASSGVGDFHYAFEQYEWRFKKNPPVQLKNDVAGLKVWDGSRVPSLVVLAEQGLGDNIMWSRYLPLLASKVDKLWVQCDHSIQVLFEDYNTCFMVSETDATHGVPMCRLVDQRGAHRAGARHTATQGRGQVAQSLPDQFTVRLMSRPGHGIEHHTGLQRVDRQQDRQGERWPHHQIPSWQHPAAQALPR